MSKIEIGDVVECKFSCAMREHNECTGTGYIIYTDYNRCDVKPFGGSVCLYIPAKRLVVLSKTNK